MTKTQGARAHAVALVAFLCCAVMCAAQAQTFPELSGRIVDQAELLSIEQEASLSATLAEHEAASSNQIVVVTLSELEGYDIADYANRLGRAWGIGTADNDNGVLLVVAPNDRKVRIEVGYGLEGALTDSLSSIIIQRHILPAFRKNDYPLGINDGAQAIMQAVTGEYTAPAGSTVGTSGSNAISEKLGNFIPLIFIAMVAIPEALRRTGRRKAANGAFPAGFSGLFAMLASGNIFIGVGIAVLAFLLVFFNSSNKGGGSGSRRGGYIGTGGGIGGGMGGGGFGGGGGSFGGGGASGGW